MVILLLVVLWIAVLAPKVIRRFRESSSQASIDDFHQQLHLLERAGPKLVEPAYRLTADEHDDEHAMQYDAASREGQRSALQLLTEDPRRTRSTQPMVRTARRRSAAAMRKARKRRRDVLLGALSVAVLTGVLGAMHDLHLLWAVTGVSVLAIAAYVALAAYAQMLHADQHAVRPIVTAPTVAAAATVAAVRRLRTTGTPAPRTAFPAFPAEPEWHVARGRHAARARIGGAPPSSTAPVTVRAVGMPTSWGVAAEAAPRHAASNG